MQIICQNAQPENVYLLVPFVNLFGQIKLTVFHNYRNGRNNWKIIKSITLVLFIQKLWLSSQNVQENNI